MRKNSKEEWQTHLWNAKNGGPMGAKTHGVRDFYKLGLNTFIYPKKYKTSWNWQTKSQYRFEQLLVKLNSALPEEKHPNVAILLMWEISSGWPSATKWAPHMVKLLHTLTKKRPVGLGTGKPEHLNFINSQTDRPVFGTYEGKDYITRLKAHPPSGKHPILCQGFQCQDCAFYSGQSPETRCKAFVSGAEPVNIKGAINNIVSCLKAGINTSLPFPCYWLGVDGYVKKVCQGKYPINTYNPGIVKKELLRFLAGFTKQVKRMKLSRIPNKRTAKKIDKWRKNNGF